MRVVDLTRTIAPSMKVFPGSPQPSFVSWSTFGAHGYDSEAVFMSTHTGTHMDAPSHFKPGAPSIDRIPASRLVCSALLVRVDKKANQLVSVRDIGDVKENDTVVIATGWEKRAAKKNYMTENPGLSEEAAKYLVKRKANAVAIDGPSIDAGFDNKFTAHNILLPANVFAVENLCNLGRVTETRFTLVITPLKLQGATGSPVRALAML